MEITAPVITALQRFGRELQETKDERNMKAGAAIIQIATDYNQSLKREEKLKETFDSLLTHLKFYGKIDSKQLEIGRNYVGIKLMEIKIQDKL